MALHYNLSKVYFMAETESLNVIKILQTFVDVAPKLLSELEVYIEQKNYYLIEKLTAENQYKLELFGMTAAFEELILIRYWAIRQGKRKEIAATFKSIEKRIEKAVKEMSKDFKL